MFSHRLSFENLERIAHVLQAILAICGRSHLYTGFVPVPLPWYASRNTSLLSKSQRDDINTCFLVAFNGNKS